MFQGSIVALVTPMDESGQLDYSALKKQLDYQLEGGTDAIVISGTTGESAALSRGEFSQTLQTALEFVAGRINLEPGELFRVLAIEFEPNSCKMCRFKIGPHRIGYPLALITPGTEKQAVC